MNIDEPMTENDADDALGPLVQYLDKNLQTLCANLSVTMAQGVIKNTWSEVVAVYEYMLLPPLFGTIDAGRRLLNKRQIGMCKECLIVLHNFFHADGEDLGLSNEILATELYLVTQNVIRSYFIGFERQKRDYEASVIANKEKEWLLRLIRIHIEKDPTLTDQKEWFNDALLKRKELDVS
jgi:hypothetical protein